MTKTFLFLVLVLALFFLLAYIRKAAGNARLYKMLGMLREGKYSDVEILATSTSSRLLLSTYSIQQILLQKAVLKKDTNDVNRIVTQLEKMKLTEQMKKDIYLEAFNYYVPMNEKKKAKSCAEKIRKLNGFDDTKRVVSLIEQVVLDGKTENLQELIHQSEQAEGTEKVGLEGLIAQIYQHLGDQKNQHKYIQKAQSDLRLMQTKQAG